MADAPGLFAIPPGCDFPQMLIQGLIERHGQGAPEDLARVELFVNTRRMARRLQELFQAGPPRLLPRIRLVTDLGADPLLTGGVQTLSPLRRKLELAALISALLDRNPELAARATIFDLADSLAALMDEMHSEGVPPQAIRDLEVPESSGHWQRALEFVRIAQDYLERIETLPDPETRQRRAVEHLAARWQEAPPEHPVIVAGSTGSRGATALFMKAVARLPQGAVVLPGFDDTMQPRHWTHLAQPPVAEDHPQYRFLKLADSLGTAPDRIAPWTTCRPPSPERNHLISLALRPAPVTGQWLSEGPQLTGIDEACARMTLVEAPDARAEALAIAIRLREAAEAGTTAALITPDRMLTRQVAAALDGWGITPDDSAGLPLQLSPPGRFLRHVADLLMRPLTTSALMTLLKHPLTNAGARGMHLLLSRDLELFLRKRAVLYPDAGLLARFAAAHNSPEAPEWTTWLTGFLGRDFRPKDTIHGYLETHIALAEALSAGPSGTTALWERSAGEEARAVVDGLLEAATGGDAIPRSDYVNLFNAVLAAGEVRDAETPHPLIKIWGTLEARVQGAELLILGGMNDGTWPEMPAPDPWLNREMRKAAGLLLPERRIGLSAHDFQQAVAAPEVWITRALRTEDAETVPSRWVNRLMNLLGGLEQGAAELEGMRMRGQAALRLAQQHEAVQSVPPAPRPSPRPPLAARPRQLSVTQIKTLIRDPYAIYARKVLQLDELNPLEPAPDALLRGTVIHAILEKLMKAGLPEDDGAAREALREIARQVLEAEVAWPVERAIWAAKLDRIAPQFIEAERLRDGTPEHFEIRGKQALNRLDFTLTGTADRIDRLPDGSLLILDYKTGQLPSGRQQENFDKQLFLEAAMAERGAFQGLDPAPVTQALFVQVGSAFKQSAADLEANPPDDVWRGLEELISAYMRPTRGFTARRAVEKTAHAGPYDHLARFGEWQEADTPEPEDLT